MFVDGSKIPTLNELKYDQKPGVLKKISKTRND